jgi:hypothetical protein
MASKRRLRTLVGTNHQCIDADGRGILIRLLDTPTIRDLERCSSVGELTMLLDAKDYELIYPTRLDDPNLRVHVNGG